jgi:mannose-6-phosphate isomerase-like protein (cupin superfamily)
VKRHQALIPLSHGHHEALVAARRLRRGADEPDPALAAAAFCDFFATAAVPHFREEEELLFPLVVDAAETRELIVQALLEHQHLHAAAAELEQVVADGRADRAVELMREVATLLEAHVRLEERRLFPLIEELLPEATLSAASARAAARDGGGPTWGTASEDLNATLLSWGAGKGPLENVNAERDVLLVVLAGSATVTTDTDECELVAGETLIIAKGRRRKITAGRDGVRYLSVHRRRPPLHIRVLRGEG